MLRAPVVVGTSDVVVLLGQAQRERRLKRKAGEAGLEDGLHRAPAETADLDRPGAGRL